MKDFDMRSTIAERQRVKTSQKAWKFIRDWEEDTSLDNIWTGE